MGNTLLHLTKRYKGEKKMKSYTTLSGFTTLVLPFRFYFKEGNNFNDFAKNNLDGWVKRKMENPYSLKHNINNMVSSNLQDKICYSYELDHNLFGGIKTEYKSFPKYNTVITLKNNDNVIGRIKLSNVILTLFYSGVAFLSLEFDTKENEDVHDIREINYYLSQLKRDKTTLEFKTKQFDEITQTSFEKNISIRIPEMYDVIMKDISKVVEVYNDDKTIDKYSSFCAGSALTYGYLLANEEDFVNNPDNKELFSNIVHNQKESYKIAPNDKDFYKPFENVLWGFALNCTYCFACLCDDEVTNQFFEKDHLQRMKGQYFTLFLLRQHQRFGLNHIEHLCSMTLYDKDNIDVTKIDVIKKMRLETGRFKIMTDYNNPSNINHINEVDSRMANALDINNSFSRIRNYINELDNYISEINSINQKENVIKSLKTNIILSIGTIIWTSLLAVNQGIELYNKWINKQTLLNSAIVIGLIVGAITIIPRLYSIYESSKDFKEKKKEVGYIKNSESILFQLTKEESIKNEDDKS